jgi:hypothetical protein
MKNPTALDSNPDPARRATALSCVWILVLAAAGCRAQAPHLLRPEALSQEAVMLDLPIVPQDSLYTCGLASISALCQYWRIEIPTPERDDIVQRAKREKGLSGRDLRATLDRLGMDVFLFQGSLDRTPTGLYHHVDQGRPPLVMISPDSSGFHYCLVLGYDEPRGNLILLDPARGQVLTPITAFDRDWARCQRFTLLACPKEEATAEVLASSEFPPTPGKKEPMKIQTNPNPFTLSLFTAVVALPSLEDSGARAAQVLRATSEVVAVGARDEPSLDSLRAGRIEAPAPLDAGERAALRSAESRSIDLLEMRAGQLTDREWTIMAVGGLIVLLIVLI